MARINSSNNVRMTTSEEACFLSTLNVFQVAGGPAQILQ